MGKAPVLKPREVVALLGKLGFVEVRQRGSHQQFRHPDGRGTTSKQPNTALQPSAGESLAPKKPSEPGRG